MIAALDLPRRLDAAFRGLAACALGVPLGLAGAFLVLVLAAGATLSLLWIGVPLVIAALAGAKHLVELDRRQANALLEAHIPPLRPRRRVAGSMWRRTVVALGSRRLWRVLGLLATKLPLSLALLVVGLAPVLLTVWLLVIGLQGIAGPEEPIAVGPWSLGLGVGVLLCLLAVPSAVVAVAVLGGLGIILRSVERFFLMPRTVAEGPIREMLAESLGDRTLAIAYWLPDRRTFVDEAGRPVELPQPGSGRAWTAVERDGRRVAAIVHDAELDTGPDLVTAAAAGAALAIDNERLKADLRARVEELRVSRVRIVEAADAARRRIERDLHDGAQQQLVALALDLRLLKARLGDNEAAPVVDELTRKLAVALAELRDLARGIHPVILTERGLGPAVEALVQRVPLPVDLEVDVGEPVSAPIEAAAYFVVAEALTNVVKYAGATSARVAIHRHGDEMQVEVDDDGAGGADPDAGTGLRGLQDRLSALDGILVVDSPPGEGTRLRATIPCAAGTLVAEARRPAVAAAGSPVPEPALEVGQ